MSGFNDLHLLKHIAESCEELKAIASEIRRPVIALLLDEVVRQVQTEELMGDVSKGGVG